MTTPTAAPEKPRTAPAENPPAGHERVTARALAELLANNAETAELQQRLNRLDSKVSIHLDGKGRRLELLKNVEEADAAIEAAEITALTAELEKQQPLLTAELTAVAEVTRHLAAGTKNLTADELLKSDFAKDLAPEIRAEITRDWPAILQLAGAAGTSAHDFVHAKTPSAHAETAVGKFIAEHPLATATLAAVGTYAAFKLVGKICDFVGDLFGGEKTAKESGSGWKVAGALGVAALGIYLGKDQLKNLLPGWRDLLPKSWLPDWLTDAAEKAVAVLPQHQTHAAKIGMSAADLAALGANNFGELLHGSWKTEGLRLLNQTGYGQLNQLRAYFAGREKEVAALGLPATATLDEVLARLPAAPAAAANGSENAANNANEAHSSIEQILGVDDPELQNRTDAFMKNPSKQGFAQVMNGISERGLPILWQEGKALIFTAAGSLLSVENWLIAGWGRDIHQLATAGKNDETYKIGSYVNEWGSQIPKYAIIFWVSDAVKSLFFEQHGAKLSLLLRAAGWPITFPYGFLKGGFKLAKGLYATYKGGKFAAKGMTALGEKVAPAVVKSTAKVASKIAAGSSTAKEFGEKMLTKIGERVTSAAGKSAAIAAVERCIARVGISTMTGIAMPVLSVVSLGLLAHDLYEIVAAEVKAEPTAAPASL